MDEVIVAETCESEGEPVEKEDFHGLHQISSSEGSSLEVDMESMSAKPVSSFDFMDDIKKIHSGSLNNDTGYSKHETDTGTQEAEEEEEGENIIEADKQGEVNESKEKEAKKKESKEENEDSVRSDVSFVPPSYDETEDREHMRREGEKEEIMRKLNEKLETKVTQESPKTDTTPNFSPQVTGSDINNLIYLQNYNTPNKSSSSPNNNNYKPKTATSNSNFSSQSSKPDFKNSKLNFENSTNTSDENLTDVKYFENSNKFIFEVDNSRIVIGKGSVFHEPYFSQDEEEENAFPASELTTPSSTNLNSKIQNNTNEDFSLTFEPTPPSSPSDNEKSNFSKSKSNFSKKAKFFGSNDETADSGVLISTSTTNSTNNSTKLSSSSSISSSRPIPPPPTPVPLPLSSSSNNNDSNNNDSNNNTQQKQDTKNTKNKNDINFHSIQESEGSQLSQQPFFFIKPELNAQEEKEKELPDKEREPVPKRRRLTKRESDASDSGNEASSDDSESERKKKIKNESITKSTSPGKSFNAKSPEKERKSPTKVPVKNENIKNNKPKPIFKQIDTPVTPPKKGKSLASNGNLWTKAKKKRIVDSDDDFQADPFTSPSPVPSSPCIAIPLHSNSPLSKTGKNFQLKKKVKDEGVTVYDLDSPVSQIYTRSNSIFFEGVTFVFTGLSKGPQYEALIKMINSHGGKIGDFPSPPTPTSTLRTTPFVILPSKFLVADKERRTLKYLLALASGTPCVQPTWVRHCCEQGCILPYVPYLLPAGYSLSREEVLYVTLPKNNILQGFRVKVSGPDEFISHWETVILATGANVLKTISNDSKGKTVIISDPFPSQEIKKNASSLNVPIVSVEWVIQCLINQVSLPFDGHPRYHYRYLRDHYTATGASTSSISSLK